jgi:hypothetical protein
MIAHLERLTPSFINGIPHAFNTISAQQLVDLPDPKAPIRTLIKDLSLWKFSNVEQALLVYGLYSIAAG